MRKRTIETLGRCFRFAILTCGALWSQIVVAQVLPQSIPDVAIARQSLAPLLGEDKAARTQAVKNLRQYINGVSVGKVNARDSATGADFLKTELFPALKNELATRQSAEDSDSMTGLLISIVRIYGKDDPGLAKSAESTIIREIARDDIDPFVRRGGFAALNLIEPLSEDTVVQLVPLIEEEDITGALTDALRGVAGTYDTFPLARDIVKSYLSHSDAAKRTAAIEAIYRIRRIPDELRGIVISRLEDPNPEVRLSAAVLFGIGEFMEDRPPEGLLEALMHAIENSDEQMQTRERIASTVSSVAHYTRAAEYVDALKQIASSTELPPSVRVRALMELPFASNYDPNLEAFLQTFTSGGHPAAVTEAATKGLRYLARAQRQSR